MENRYGLVGEWVRRRVHPQVIFGPSATCIFLSNSPWPASQKEYVVRSLVSQPRLSDVISGRPQGGLGVGLTTLNWILPHVAAELAGSSFSCHISNKDLSCHPKSRREQTKVCTPILNS